VFGFVTNQRMLAWAAGSLVLAVVLAWARDTMRATVFNRRVAASGIFLFVIQNVLVLGAIGLDLPPAQTGAMMILTWGIVTGMLAIAVDPWLAPSAVLYFVGFGLVVRDPDSRFYVSALVNFGFAVNAVWRWRPATFNPTPEERERIDRGRSRRRRS